MPRLARCRAAVTTAAGGPSIVAPAVRRHNRGVVEELEDPLIGMGRCLLQNTTAVLRIYLNREYPRHTQSWQTKRSIQLEGSKTRPISIGGCITWLVRPTTTHQSGPNSFRFVESSSCGHGHRRCPSSAAPLPTACVPPRLTDRPLCDPPIRLCRLMPWQSVPALAIISGAIGLAGGIILAVDTGIMGKVLLRQPPACIAI